MEIFLNNNKIEVKQGITLLDWMRSKELHEKSGVAVALNNRVVPKEKWEHTVLQENDMLLLIGASYGG
ncbi:sulfur carrier protein ThiS [bacterium]|nr:sulfur carrier protein ThiS [bacterium]